MTNFIPLKEQKKYLISPGMIIKYFSFIAAFLVSVYMNGQSLTAYVDGRGYFNVFDNGITSTLEYQQPPSFQVGGNCVAYMDFNSNFKVYYNGETIVLYNGPVNKYQVTHNLVLYVIAGQLRVFDRGKTKTISTWSDSYAAGNSLVAFYDNTYRAFYVYYNHDLFTLENNTGQYPITDFKVSDNTLAYINNLGEFKIYWNGGAQKIYTLSPGFTINYQTGSNVVAFGGNPAGLYAFYKGNVFTLTSTPVTDFVTGDDMVAFTDPSGVHVFYAGKTYDMGTSYNAVYNVVDSMMVYYSPGYFKVFNRGKIQILENYKPEEFAIDNNTMVWTNQQGG